MQLGILVFLMGFMMPINVRHYVIRHNVITISLYDIIFIKLKESNYQLLPHKRPDLQTISCG